MSAHHLYSIKEVAARVGLSPAVLRKWEDRYCIVQPQRLANGYRGYSEQDLAVLRWIAAQIRQGAMTRTAVAEARRRLANGWSLGAGTTPVAGDILPEERRRLLRCLLAADSAGAIRALDELMGRVQVETVLLEVVEPLLYHVGLLWERGEISEYQEAFASVLVRDRLSALRAVQPQPQGPRLLVTCVPGEQHELGALVFSLVAVRQGFHVTCLGASPSPDGLIHAVAHLKPRAVCMSVTTPQRLTEALPALRQVRESTDALLPPPLLVLGGQGLAGGATAGLEGYRLEAGRADHALDRLRRDLSV